MEAGSKMPMAGYMLNNTSSLRCFGALSMGQMTQSSEGTPAADTVNRQPPTVSRKLL
jgi:hypothetical protein